MILARCRLLARPSRPCLTRMALKVKVNSEVKVKVNGEVGLEGDLTPWANRDK
ncbi:MAG: hypothetical protein U0P81_02435 [Holophagaceae bacterium]